MKYISRTLVLSGLCLAVSQVNAGGFDNNSRSFNLLYSDKDVIEMSYGHTSVPMEAKIEQAKNSGASGTINSGDVVGRFERPQVGIKMQVQDNLSCAAQYERPYAASVEYSDDSLSYETDADGTARAPIATNYDSKSFTFACGYDFALSTGSIKVFGGPKAQKISGSFSQDLSTNNLGETDNLSVDLKTDTEIGFIAGIAYSIPEIALRASLLYHSQIDYDAYGTNTFMLPLGGANFETVTTSTKAKTFTPQALELAFQSGIASNTLAFLKLRWAEYSKLKTLESQSDESVVVQANGATLAQVIAMNPAADGLVNPDLDLFSNDTLDYSFGLGHKWNDQLSLGVSYAGGIKLGSKDDTIPLGADSKSLRLPGDDKHSLLVGGTYLITPEFKMNAGLGYTFIDSYTVQTESGNFRAEFDKTESTSVQVGLSYFM